MTPITPTASIERYFPVLPLPLRIALSMVATAVVACWVALAAIHVDDDYEVSHYHGVWMAVSEAARAGRLYPPIFDGEHYAGTRYMPLPILLNAVGSAVAGNSLVGGKLISAVLMAILLVLICSLLRRLSCPWPLAVALAAVVVATKTGLRAGSTVGGDLLPLVLQVGALAVALRPYSRAVVLVAGGLAGLAIASKLTGLWAFLAITTWLIVRRQWRPAAIFAATSAGTAVSILATIQLITGGSLSDNLLTLWAAGIRTPLSIIRAPAQVLYNLLGHASAAVVLVPLAAIGALLAERVHQLSMIHLALGYAVALLVVVYADIGTGPNQLIDVVVLTVLATGYLAGCAMTDADPRARRVGVSAVAVTVIWAASLDLVRTEWFDLRQAVSAIRAGEAPAHGASAVARMVRSDEEVLAEDPSIALALGRRPVVVDPFMVLQLDRTHPEQVDPLISWISTQRFDLIVLVMSLEDPSADFWWTDFAFGPRVEKALRRAYIFDRRVGRYFLYRPGRGVRESARSR